MINSGEKSMADSKIPEINSIMITGNLTRDPVYRQTTNNTPVVNFSIASNKKYKDYSNRWQEDVCYVDIVAWDKLAESCRDKLQKGSAIFVDGELQSRNWKTENGQFRSAVEIKARRIQFLSKLKTTNELNNGNDSQFNEEQKKVSNENINFSEDSFDKFLSGEEFDLLK
jgi:single-strand DNA-binding protein